MEHGNNAPSSSSEVKSSQEIDPRHLLNVQEPHPKETPAGIASSHHPPTGDIPDGGLKAWLQVIGVWVIMLLTWGLVNTFGVYQTYYQTVLLTGTSASSISWIGSLQACFTFLFGLVSGPLFDAGYFTATLVTGLFLITFGMFMTSLCSEYWQVVLAQGLCVGMGMGLIFLLGPSLLSQYFRKRRIFAVGLSATGSPIGGIIFPIIFSRLLPQVGFGWATRVIAFICLGLSIIPVVSMRPRLPPSGHVRSVIDNTVWTDLAFMTFSIATMLSFLVLYTAFFYVQLFDEQYGLSTSDFAPYTVTLISVGSVFGRTLPAYLSDKFGVINMTLISTLACGVLVFGWMGIHNLAGLIVFVILYGVFSGGIVAGSAAGIIHLSPDMSRIGTRMGMAFAMSGLSVLIGTPIVGAILGDFSRTRWLGGMGYSGAGLILATLFLVVTWVTVYKKEGTWKI